ncbi:cystathionine beta-lyase [Polymorphobacter sp.]|uniref:cystathionine beta-lyase n=1 Tax=Polymorphobacter sp. TaxID=1909290 RepID=UPI003F6E4558
MTYAETESDECTRLAHCESDCTTLLRTPAPPVQRGSTVLLADTQAIYDHTQVTYGRGGLATQRALSAALAQLEMAEQAFLYPSGLAAITGVILAICSAGDELLVSDCVYNPTRRFLGGTMARYGITARYFDPSASVDEIAAMITPATRAIFLESPGSLTMEMQDVPAIARMARTHGVLTVIDNTWAAGVLFKPLAHGIDISIQSLTKYVCGHSDVFMGMAAASGEAAAMLARGSHEIGWAVSPDDAYMALRGLRTLHTRLAQHGRSAAAIAQWLAAQPEVQSVLCPALPDFPGHAIWKRDFSGTCGLLSFVLAPDHADSVDTMLDSLRLFGLGYSWGGFESLVIPCDPQLASRTCTGTFSGPLVRIHVGLESVEDLQRDLRRGLDRLGDKAHLSARTIRAVS